MGPEAQHQIQQQHLHRRIGENAPDKLAAHGLIHHGMGSSQRVEILARIHDPIAGALRAFCGAHGCDSALHPEWMIRNAGPQHQRRFRGQGPATKQAHQAPVAARQSSGVVFQATEGIGGLVTRGERYRLQGGLVQAFRVSHTGSAFQRRLSQVANHDRFFQTGEGLLDLVRNRPVGMLGHEHDDPGLFVRGQELEAELSHQAAHLAGEVGASHSDGLGDPLPHRVHQASYLLDAGSRGPHQTDAPAAHTVCKAQAHAGHDGGPAVRTHHQEAQLARPPLQLYLLVYGNIVREQKDVLSRIQRAMGDVGGVGPRHRHRDQVRLGLFFERRPDARVTDARTRPARRNRP